MPVCTITQESNFFSLYGALSGTFVVPVPDDERAARLGERAVLRQPQRVALAGRQRRQPHTSSRIGQLPASSGASSAIDADAPAGPVIAIVCTGSSGLSRPPIA